MMKMAILPQAIYRFNFKVLTEWVSGKMCSVVRIAFLFIHYWFNNTFQVQLFLICSHTYWKSAILCTHGLHANERINGVNEHGYWEVVILEVEGFENCFLVLLDEIGSQWKYEVVHVFSFIVSLRFTAQRWCKRNNGKYTA